MTNMLVTDEANTTPQTTERMREAGYSDGGTVAISTDGVFVWQPPKSTEPYTADALELIVKFLRVQEELAK